MGRKGKLKYKDVVKKPKQPKKIPKKAKQKKTYSLYKNDGNKKRKRNFSEENNAKKLKKIEEMPKIEPLEESSDSLDEEEEEGDLTSLLNTFNNESVVKKMLAIETSSESESEQEDIEENEKSGTEQDSDSEETDNEKEIIKKQDTDNENDKLDNLAYVKRDKIEEHNTDEDNEIEIDDDVHKEEENDINNDPFVKHLCYDLHESILDSLQNVPLTVNNYNENWPVLGKLFIQLPQCEKIVQSEKGNFSILEKKMFAPEGTVPTRISKSASLEELFIKSQIVNDVKKVNTAISNSEGFTPLQNELFSIINNYQDLYYPQRTFANSEEIRFVYCLHAVNHILKTRTKILHHNAKLTKKDDVPEEFRDQGLVRPKVLIIVPFKDSAYKIVRMIIDILLSEDKGNVMHKMRFIEDYTGNELILPKKHPKPEDYEQIFQGNTSDDFKIGITITKKSLKLYADFYSSDIILASPLGLRTIIGAEGEPERNYDFLASLELLVLDQTDVFLMQNWDHVIHIFNHLHLQPKDSHGTDFFRVRTWSLNGWAKYYRQTLIFSSIVLPEINSIFNKKCLNYAGKVKVINPIEYGCISQVVVQVPHVFHRFDCKSASEAIDDRFSFFISKILPQQRESLMKQTLIFVPSYFDFVKIRNHFNKEDIGFVQICEYTKDAKVARARDMFFHGDAHFLLFTERYHFFHRRRIKGIRHLVFYQLPVFPHFYSEMCNLMQEGYQNRKVGSQSNISVTVIYSKFDAIQLSTIVGTEKATKMIQSDRKVHMMITGGR